MAADISQILLCDPDLMGLNYKGPSFTRTKGQLADLLWQGADMKQDAFLKGLNQGTRKAARKLLGGIYDGISAKAQEKGGNPDDPNPIKLLNKAEIRQIIDQAVGKKENDASIYPPCEQMTLMTYIVKQFPFQNISTPDSTSPQPQIKTAVNVDTTR